MLIKKLLINFLNLLKEVKLKTLTNLSKSTSLIRRFFIFMTEKSQPEIIHQRVCQLIDNWQQQAMPKEKFEYPLKAVDILTQDKDQSIPIISMICANYETFTSNGKKRPTLHNEMVWTDRGLRKGYVLCHEEIPARLLQLQQTSQRSINHLIVLVDQGMADTLYTDLNPRVAQLDNISIGEDINETLDQNSQTIQALLNDSLNPHPHIQTIVKRLTQIVSKDFFTHWSFWNQQLRACILESNNRWAGRIRKDLTKDARYYKEVWGLNDQPTLEKRVIDQQYGLTAVIGDWLHLMHNSVFQQSLESKSDLILLDTIPGPDNPAHSEFIAYNADAPDGTFRDKTPILRPFYNLVLLSDSAIEVPYLDKSLDDMQNEANELPF